MLRIRRRGLSCLRRTIMSMLQEVRFFTVGMHTDTDAHRTGQSVFHDPISNRDVMVYHYVPDDAPIGGPSYLGINYLDFSSGWPVVLS